MFFYKKNLSSHEMFKVEKPWEFESKAPYDTTDKAEFTSWCSRAETNHMFVTVFEGFAPSVSVSKDNPVRYIHGFLADYDGIVPDDPVKAVLKKYEGGYLPTWVVLSRGQNAHVVWDYELPLTAINNDHAKKFQEHVGKQTKASKMFGCLDKASYEPHMCFEVGRKWLPVPGARPLPAELLRVWDMDVAKNMRARGFTQGYTLPMEVVAAEAEKRWPGRCRNFEIGAHCLRFWDKDSDNETGCVICADGVRVYVTGPTGGKDAPFKTWTQIFDAKFVEEHRAARYNDVLGECYFDSKTRTFWLKDEEGNYESHTTQALTTILKSRGFSAKLSQGSTSSEVDDLLSHLMERCRVDRTECRLFHKTGLLFGASRERLLNRSKVRPIPPSFPMPAITSKDWNTKEVHDAFPFIHDVITRLFDNPATIYNRPLDFQLRYLLAWMAYFYRSSYDEDPGSGQALFLCGGVGLGKTFFSHHILGPLMGGWAAANDYFMGNNQWSSELLTRGLMTIDDEESHIDPRAARKFQSKIKSFVANGHVISNGKYEACYTAVLPSRLVVTLNDDPNSRGILPPLDSGTRGKMSLLFLPETRWAKPLDTKGLSRSDKETSAAEELPMFARWLYEHEVPEDLKDPRFGTVAICHPELDHSAAMSGYGLEVMEALEIALRGHAEGFCGNATELLELLCECSRSLSRHLNVQRLVVTLAAFEKDGYSVEIVRAPEGNTYKIPSNLRELGRRKRSAVLEENARLVPVQEAE